MPANSWTSPALHSQVPPMMAQSCCKVHAVPPGSPTQQHGALEWQSELAMHGHANPPKGVAGDGRVVVVVVTSPAQPVVVHASQQLAKLPTHACPPLGGSHAAALDFTVHFVLPFAFVLQHVTLPGGFAQVERAAHFVTALHAGGRVPLLISAFT